VEGPNARGSGGWANQARGRTARELTIRGCLDSADDHCVNGVQGNCKQQPQKGGEEETAHDLAYAMGLEEAVGGGLV
jgi:hypothetical protein